MITIRHPLLRLSAGMIKLYPADFHRDFGEEIQSTLYQLLQEYARRGTAVLLGNWLFEMWALLLSIFREQRRARKKGELKMKSLQWPWQKLVLVLLPLLFWLGILQLTGMSIFHNPQVLYQATDGSMISRDQFLAGLSPLARIQAGLLTLDVFSPYAATAALSFVVLGLVLIGLAWWKERRFPAMGLPILGMIFYFSVLAAGNLLPLQTSYRNVLSGLLPLFLLLAWLGWQRRQAGTRVPAAVWKWFLAIPLVALAAVLSGSLFDTAVFSGQFASSLERHLSGAFLAIGPAAFAILIGLSLTPRYGAKAILFVLGFICFALMTPLQGLEANGGAMTTGMKLSFVSFQATESALFVTAFLLVAPVLYLFGPSRSLRFLGVLLPAAAAYGLMIVVQGYEEGWTGHLMVLTGNLIELLIGLSLAIALYEHLYPGSAGAESPSIGLETAHSPVLSS